MAIQNLRSSQAHRRAIPSLLSAGQICINTNEASPGLFFKDSNGDLVKVGPVHIGTSAPNSSPDSLGAGSLVTGTVYQILTLGTSDFTAVGASANTVGTIFTATGTTTGTGTVSTGVQGNEKGEQWLDTTSGYDLKIYDGSAWRSQAGEFVNVTGDNMTGALGVVAGTASAPGVFFSGDTNTGLLAPAADSVAITTGGTQRMRIESSGYAKFNSGFVFVQSSASGSSDSDGLALISDTNADAYVWNYENTTLRFGTNATERMRIDSSGRLLVNTTTEGHSDADNLTIADSSKAGITIRNTITTGDGAIFFSDATSGTAEYAGYIEYGHSTNHLRFATASVEQMRIDSSGNVGIGNSAPAYKLSVLTTGTSDTSLHLATTGGASDNGDATNSIRFTGGNNTKWANAKYEAFTHIFNANGAEQLRIDSSGRLLVGTSSASKNADRLTGNKIASVGVGSGVYPSHVITGYTSGNNDAGPLIDLQKSRGSSDGSMTVVASSDRLGTLNFLGSDGTNFIRAADITAYVDGTPGTNDMPGRLVLATTADGASSPTERMRIDSAGNVGIGSSNPTSLGSGFTEVMISGNTEGAGLQLQDTDGNVKAGLFTSDNSNTATLRTITNHPLTFRTNNTEAMRIDGTGRVGFGVTTMAGGSSSVTIIRNSALRWADSDGTQRADIYGDSNSNLVFRNGTGSAERMRITNSGNVGIGSIAPVRALQIGAHGTGNGEMALAASTTGNCSILMGDGATGSDFYRGYIQYQNANDALVFATAATQRMAIDSSGRVGINTSSPAATLSVDALAGNSTVCLLKSSTVNAYLQLGNSANDQGYVGYQSSDMTFYTAASERMRIDSSGLVNVTGGIQVTENVTPTTGSGVEIFKPTSTTGQLQAFNRSGSTWMDLILKGNAQQFYTNNFERMRIDSSGRLLIGNSSTSNNGLLCVKGSASSSTAGGALTIQKGAAVSGANQHIGTLSFGEGSANTAEIKAFTGSNWSGSSRETYLTFETTPSGSAGPTERMRIDSSGNVELTTTDSSGTQQILFSDGTSGRGKLVYRHNGDSLAFETLSGERMRIDSAGNIGIGTTSPTQKLDVRGSIYVGDNIGIDNSSPSSYASDGRDLVVGSGSGSHGITIATGASNSGTIYFADGTSGTSLYTGTITYNHSSNYMAFWTNATERMRIDSNGDLILNATTADVGNAGTIVLRPNGNGTSKPFVGLGTTATNNSSVSWAIYSTTIPQYQFYVGHAGTVFARSTSISALSDEREKENIRNLDTGLSEILQLQPRRFDWKNGSGQNLPGFVAQEVETVLPDLVDDYRLSDTETRKALKMGDLVPTLVKALQETHAKIETLEAKVAALEAG